MKTNGSLCASLFGALALLLGSGSAARAQANVYFPNDATINYAISGSAVVGYANDADYANQKNGSSPTVSFVAGSKAGSGGGGGVSVYNHGTVNLKDGSSVYNLSAYNNSVVNISAAANANTITAGDASQVTISGGRISSVFASGNSVVTITGGTVFSDVLAGSGGAINISGGALNSPYLYIYPGGSLNLSGAGLSATLTGSRPGSEILVYTLKGTLTDGTDVSGKSVVLYTINGAQFTINNNAVTPPSVSGSLAFEGIVPSAAAQNVTFTFRPADGSANITFPFIAVPASGAFNFTGIPQKKYTVHIKGDKYLATNVNVDTTGGNVSGVTAFLPAGDANNDNSVDSSDFGVLIGAFGSDASVPGSGYDPTADFNGDGVVDSTDFGLLIGEFNNSGAL